MDTESQNEVNHTSYVLETNSNTTGCDNGIPVKDMHDLNSSNLMGGGDYEYYELTNDQSLPLNDEALSNNILMENIDHLNVVVSDNSNVAAPEQTEALDFNNTEKYEKVVRTVEGEFIGVFDPSNLTSRPRLIFNQEDQKDIIEMIETYNNTAFDTFSGQNSAFVDSTQTEMFVNETNEKNITLFDETESSQRSNMLYYSEDSNNLQEEGEAVYAASRPLSIRSVSTYNDTESENLPREECTVFNVMSSIGADQSADTQTQYTSVQNDVLIYSTDPTTETIFESSFTDKNAELIEVLDSVEFSTNPKFALLDEEGNIVGLLHSDSQLKEITPNTTSDNTSQALQENNTLNIDNMSQTKTSSSFKKTRQSGKSCKESKGVNKNQRRSQKQLNQFKSFEPQINVKSCSERRESWSNDVPSQPAPTPEILVLHPLRTRRHTARRNLDINNSPNINRNVAKTLEKHFNRISITVPLIGNSHGVERGRRRKQKISLLKEAKCYINGEFNLDSSQSIKSYFDRYAFDSDIPEINEIFSRKKKVIANNKDIEVKSDSSHLNAFCDIKNAPTRKRLDFTTETESSDEEPQYKAEVGKSLKCTKCSKIFKSSRSVSIHNKFCKAKSFENHIRIESPKQGKYILSELNCSRNDTENEDVNKKFFESPNIKKRKLTTRSHGSVKRKA